MKTYYMLGWHGQLNTGDDAFAIVTSWGLRHYCQANTIVMESDASGILHKKYNIKLVQTQSFYIPGLSRLLRRFYYTQSKSLIFAGGSLFNDKELNNFFNSYMFQKKKIIAIGVSVGPFVSLQHEKNTLEFLKKMDYIGFRDDFSYNWAASKNIDIAFSKAFDLAVLLPLAVNYQFTTTEKSKRIGFSLLAFNYLKNPNELNKDIEFIQNLAKSTYSVIKDRGFKITLYSLCRHHFYNDDIICEAFLDSFPNKSDIEIFKHDGDAYRTWLAMKKCSHIVSMRLHGSVFAYINQTPLLLMEYHPKCRDFADMVGLDNKFCFNLNNFEPDYYKNSLSLLLEESQIQTHLSLKSAQECALINFKGYTDW
ncbi:MAG: polysaccharide pyruvyl transferase family protein [Pseudomonadota bacterium]